MYSLYYALLFCLLRLFTRNLYNVPTVAKHGLLLVLTIIYIRQFIRLSLPLHFCAVHASISTVLLGNIYLDAQILCGCFWSEILHIFARLAVGHPGHLKQGVSIAVKIHWTHVI